jgi:cyanophycinase
MSKGKILIEGGAEFGGGMAAPDLRALALAGGSQAQVVILPTAAAPDHNDRRAGANGVRWFKSLGAQDVVAVPVVDWASANNAAYADLIRTAGLVYLLGGFTHYLGQTLAGSLCWQAALEAYFGGAVIGGSSAGAMVLCQYYFNPERYTLEPGLNLIPNACLIPHHNTFGQGWSSRISALQPGVVIIGVDEQTGAIDDDADGAWNVYGKGAVTVYRNGGNQYYQEGTSFRL